MSWDIVLFSSEEKISSIETMDETKLKPIEFDRILMNSFEEVNSNESHREIIGNGFSIDFHFSDEKVSNTMISIYGEKGLFEIVNLAKKYNWQVFDTSIDDFIDLENPDRNGYANFKSYVNQITDNRI